MAEQAQSRAPTLAVACVFRDATYYLREWIEHYWLMGARRFYMCAHVGGDGGSVGADAQQVLQPYVDAGVVILTRCALDAGPYFDTLVRTPFFESVLRAAEGDVDWVLCVDADEFAVPTRDADPDLVTVLARHADAPALYANWFLYGTSDVDRVPDGMLLTEALVRRAADNAPYHRFVRAFVQPSRFVRMVDVQMVLADDQTAGRFTDGTPRDITGVLPQTPIADELRINHYITGDKQHFAKYKVPMYMRTLPPGPVLQEALTRARHAAFDEVTDDMAARRFAPALRARMLNAPEAAAAGHTDGNADERVCILLHVDSAVDNNGDGGGGGGGEMVKEWNSFYRAYVHNVCAAVPCDVYVTCPTIGGPCDGVQWQRWQKQVRALCAGAARAREDSCRVTFLNVHHGATPIEAFLVAVDHVSRRAKRAYAYALRMHTKAMPHGPGWRTQVADALAGSVVRIHTILATLDSNEQMGMLGLESWMQTDGVRADIDKLSASLGLEQGSPNTFLGGGMYWVRLEPLLRAVALMGPKHQGWDGFIDAFLKRTADTDVQWTRRTMEQTLERIVANVITESGHQVRGTFPDLHPSLPPADEMDRLQKEEPEEQPNEEQEQHTSLWTLSEVPQPLTFSEAPLSKREPALWNPHGMRALGGACVYMLGVASGANAQMRTLFDTSRQCASVIEFAPSCGGASWALALGIAYGRLVGTTPIDACLHPSEVTVRTRHLDGGDDKDPAIVTLDMGPVFARLYQSEDATAHAAETRYDIESERAHFVEACALAGIKVAAHAGTVEACAGAIDGRAFDMLYVDSWHVAAHVKHVLGQYHARVRRFIVLHGTSADEQIGETVRAGRNVAREAEHFGYAEDAVWCGVRPAIEAFLDEHARVWRLAHRSAQGHGLTVLERILS